MEIQNINTQNTQQEEMWKSWEADHRRGKILGGILLVAAGSLFLARELGANIPAWIFTWKTLLIAVSVVGLIKHRFRRLGFLFPILVGSGFMVADLYPEMALRHFIWPVAIIILGLIFIFKPRRSYRHWHK